MTTTDHDAPAPRPTPITAPDCAELAAGTLRTAEQVARRPDGAASALALADIADKWRQLGVSLSQHAGLNRPTPEGTHR